jgi:hypothetical protein
MEPMECSAPPQCLLELVETSSIMGSQTCNMTTGVPTYTVLLINTNPPLPASNNPNAPTAQATNQADVDDAIQAIDNALTTNGLFQSLFTGPAPVVQTIVKELPTAAQMRSYQTSQTAANDPEAIGPLNAAPPYLIKIAVGPTGTVPRANMTANFFAAVEVDINDRRSPAASFSNHLRAYVQGLTNIVPFTVSTAIHEILHAMGLQDRYVDAVVQTPDNVYDVVSICLSVDFLVDLVGTPIEPVAYDLQTNMMACSERAGLVNGTFIPLTMYQQAIVNSTNDETSYGMDEIPFIRFKHHNASGGVLALNNTLVSTSHPIYDANVNLTPQVRTIYDFGITYPDVGRSPWIMNGLANNATGIRVCVRRNRVRIAGITLGSAGLIAIPPALPLGPSNPRRTGFIPAMSDLDKANSIVTFGLRSALRVVINQLQPAIGRLQTSLPLPQGSCP